jgi:hypothetical protein
LLKLRISHALPLWRNPPVALSDNPVLKDVLRVDELSKANKKLWRAWLNQHPLLAPDRPRATWAQILYAFGFREISNLVHGPRISADTIPTALDAPLQRVKLGDIGYLAMAMGLTDVKIDASNRLFEATGRYGSIKVEEVPSLGDVLRFEGNIFKIRADVTRCRASWVSGCSRVLLGEFLVGDGMICARHYRLDVIFRGVAGAATSMNDVTRQLHQPPDWAELNDQAIASSVGDFRIEALAAKSLSIGNQSGRADSGVQDVDKTAHVSTTDSM